MRGCYTSVSRYGNSILYRGYNENGVEVRDKFTFSPTLYVKSEEETEYKSLYGESLKPIKFDTMREAKEFLERYGDVDNFKVHGNQNYIAQFIASKFSKIINWKPEWIRVGNFDIEVASDDGFPEPDEAKHPVISIAYKDSKSNVYHVWGLGDFDAEAYHKKSGMLVEYRKCKNEIDLLTMFVYYWENNCPDVVTGWNIRLFDIPYLINRIHNVIGEETAKRLSPWNLISHRKIAFKGKKLDTYEITGVQQIDYLDTFQKFDYVHGTQESYALDHIAFVVLGERKLSYEEHGSLHGLYKADHQKFIEYNIRDVDLVDRIDQELGLIERVLTIAYKGKVNFIDAFGTTSIWDSIIYNYLLEDNIVPPPTTDKFKSDYPGGYVKDPQVGIHDWVVSFDLNSLYPNLIVQYNMSPETILKEKMYHVSGDKVEWFMENPPEVMEDYAIAANGAMFRKDKRGVIPGIIIEYYNERKEIKNKMLALKAEYQKNPTKELDREINILDNAQMAVKILLNSLYGALGNRWFRYFDMRVAEGITLSGQLAIKWAERTANKCMNKYSGTGNIDYVIAMDTDSLYMNMSSLIKKFNPGNPVKFLDEVCEKKFIPQLRDSYQELANRHNAFENRMVMAREAIADRGLWTAKKRYILNVHNNEGVQYAEPKMKIMGIEAVKSSTPMVVRNKFKEVFKIVLLGTEEEFHEYIKTFEKDFKNLPPEDVSFPRGTSEIEKWMDKNSLFRSGTPIHVRGAILYNHFLKLKNIDKNYEQIQAGNKVKFCYLKTPNPITQNVISFPNYLPKELNLHDYIDYDTQFEKTFKKPLEPIADAMGWTLVKINTLESLFE